ncbi:MAG: diphthamide synthesis protein [Parcubacteria group bacterium]|nr:diphthamide synthesis protein [Parcubacteria group bacterium]
MLLQKYAAISSAIRVKERFNLPEEFIQSPEYQQAAKEAEKIQDKVDAFLYIGSGEFHPLGVALSAKKDVFTFNPATSIFSKLSKEEVEKYKKQKKARLSKFLASDNIGILISLKPGQYSYRKADEIKNGLKQKGKNCFIFVFDTLDANELNNFPFVDFWVNTACPRIADDKDKKNIIDMSEIL